MTRQTPAELAGEQWSESMRWLDTLRHDLTRGSAKDDGGTIAHLHKSLARLMGNYQKFRRERETAQEGSEE